MQQDNQNQVTPEIVIYINGIACDEYGNPIDARANGTVIPHTVIPQFDGTEQLPSAKGGIIAGSIPILVGLIFLLTSFFSYKFAGEGTVYINGRIAGPEEAEMMSHVLAYIFGGVGALCIIVGLVIIIQAIKEAHR